MTEAEYWDHLEYRLCREFWGMADKQLRSLWCDGLVPDRYDLQGPRPAIHGIAWFGTDGQGQWTFELLLRASVPSRKEISWATLLPAEDQTKWVAVDLGNSSLHIAPASAVPDLGRSRC